MNLPKFQKGDLVMFSHRTQITSRGMEVQEAEDTLFGPRYKVDHKWWTEGCFISFVEWQDKYYNC